MKVLYIMGMGRSGSTLLDVLVGSHPDAIGTGELANLVGQAWSNGERCACGMDATECPFWSTVREQWLSEVGPGASAEYPRLQASVERSGRLPWLGRRSAPGLPTADRYGVLTTALFRATDRASDKAMIVDSSKNPARALALSRLVDVDLFVVHLVRDGRAVAWSYAKRFAREPAAGIQVDQPGVPAWRSALRWDLINLQSEWVRRQLPRGRSIQVRYEDLMNDPQATIERIGTLVGLEVSDLADSLAAGTDFPIGHPVAGNRLRMAGSVRLQPDEAWRRKMARQDQTRVRMLAWPLMARYGYR